MNIKAFVSFVIDSNRPRDIDLHVNTRLLIKSNKKFDYLKTLLVLVLIFETIMFYIVYNKVTSDVQTMERLMYQTRSAVEDISMTKRKVDKLYKVLLNSYVKTNVVNRHEQIMRHIQKRDVSAIDMSNRSCLLYTSALYCRVLNTYWCW